MSIFMNDVLQTEHFMYSSMDELLENSFVFYSGSFILYVHKNFPKKHIFYELIRTGMFAYHGVKNVSFSENFPYILINVYCINCILYILKSILIFLAFSTSSLRILETYSLHGFNFLNPISTNVPLLYPSKIENIRICYVFRE